MLDYFRFDKIQYILFNRIWIIKQDLLKLASLLWSVLSIKKNPSLHYALVGEEFFLASNVTMLKCLYSSISIITFHEKISKRSIKRCWITFLTPTLAYFFKVNLITNFISQLDITKAFIWIKGSTSEANICYDIRLPKKSYQNFFDVFSRKWY